MTELVGFRISIRITTNRAGMCGITVCRTGRSGYNACIIMFAGCRDCLSYTVLISASRTCLMLGSALAAGCVFVYNPCIGTVGSIRVNREAGVSTYGTNL